MEKSVNTAHLNITLEVRTRTGEAIEAQRTLSFLHREGDLLNEQVAVYIGKEFIDIMEEINKTYKEIRELEEKENGPTP